MYCKKCGTYIDGESELCPACQAQEDFNFNNNTNVTNNEPIYTEEEKSKDRRAGLSTAITGCVFGAVSSFLVGIGMGLIEVAPAVGIIFSLIAVVFSVLALVKGIQSIKTFINFSKQGKAKPIATLIVGIGGVVWAALDLYFIFLTFFIVLIALSML